MNFMKFHEIMTKSRKITFWENVKFRELTCMNRLNTRENVKFREIHVSRI